MLQKKQKVKNWFIQLQLNKQILYVEALLFMILTLAVVWLVRCVTNLNVNKCDYVYTFFDSSNQHADKNYPEKQQTFKCPRK